MLHTRTVLSRDGLTVADVACRHDLGHGQPAQYTGGHTLVFVRRGWFRRSANGVEALLDPTVAYCINPGEEERYDHPHGDDDDCTALGLDPARRRRPAPGRARRMLADGAREALGADPLRSLPDLACALSVSPAPPQPAFSIRSPDTPSPAIASRCACEPPSTASPTAIRSDTGQTPSALRHLLAMKRGK
ncbi:MAG: hypothetical protein LC808_29920 [Actinobacteria bacterium]|nr:hypothetical protein [Actinomycetota bacterium]